MTNAVASSRAQGRHWLIDCSDCRCDPAILSSKAVLEAACVELCEQAGMQIVGCTFHQFEPAGVTGVVLLAESHLSVHTWPDQRFAAIDVYVCNHQRDNSSKGSALATAVDTLFLSSRSSVREVVRESVDQDLRNA